MPVGNNNTAMFRRRTPANPYATAREEDAAVLVRGLDHTFAPDERGSLVVKFMERVVVRTSVESYFDNMIDIMRRVRSNIQIESHAERYDAMDQIVEAQRSIARQVLQISPGPAVVDLQNVMQAFAKSPSIAHANTESLVKFVRILEHNLQTFGLVPSFYLVFKDTLGEGLGYGEMTVSIPTERGMLISATVNRFMMLRAFTDTFPARYS